MKFRANAQKKRIDVWLIYRCDACGETWNLPIFERVTVGDIAPDLFQAIARNDLALAKRHAFDATRFARHGERVEESPDATVEWLTEGAQPIRPSTIEISIHLVLPYRVRLDRFVARHLGISRTQLRSLHEAGLLAVAPSTRNGLRGPITDGQRIAIRLGPDPMSRDLMAAIRDRTRP